MITILSRSMTLQQKGVQAITLLFDFRFYTYLTERIINGKKQELMAYDK